MEGEQREQAGARQSSHYIKLARFKQERLRLNQHVLQKTTAEKVPAVSLNGSFFYLVQVWGAVRAARAIAVPRGWPSGGGWPRRLRSQTGQRRDATNLKRHVTILDGFEVAGLTGPGW